MTPEEFEKIVKDYSKNGLPEGSALICLHGGKYNFGAVRGKSTYLATTIAINMFADKKFARLVRLACDFYDAEGGPETAEAAKENTQQEADRIAKDFLRNAGFKLEGE